MTPTGLPSRPQLRPGAIRADWWHALDDGRVQCDLCPRRCRLREGQRGFCYVRRALDGGVALTSYGRSSGFCVDPIEKKPLHHFHPGSTTYSFGTAGCCLGCRFCQNWDISKARDDDRLAECATPDGIAAAAAASGCRSVAFTYNDPVIFAEFAIDCARAAHERGLATVAVTSGYIEPEARQALFASMDAANVDLKALDPDFYRRLCFAELEPVLDTLRWLRRETGVWLEVTHLLIPGHNDGDDQVARLCDWVAAELGADVPLHLTAFYPAFRMLDVPPAAPSTLRRARRRAIAAGLRYVYTGNIRDPEGQSTTCAGCTAMLVARDVCDVRIRDLGPDGLCRRCGAPLPGRFDGGAPVPVPGDEPQTDWCG